MCPALTYLRLANIRGGTEWGDLWRSLARLRSLRQLAIEGYIAESANDFASVTCLERLPGLDLKLEFYDHGNHGNLSDLDVHGNLDRVIPLQLSRLLGLTQV